LGSNREEINRIMSKARIIRALYAAIFLCLSLGISFALVEGASRAYKYVEGSNLHRDPCCGFTFIPNLKDEPTYGYSAEFVSSFSTNEYGFVDLHPWDGAVGRGRVGFFGGSYVAARQAPMKDRFSDLVEKATGHEVVNFGVDSYSIINSIFVLESFAKKSGIEKAILFLSIGDLYNDQMYMTRNPGAVEAALAAGAGAPLALPPPYRSSQASEVMVKIFDNSNLLRLAYYTALYPYAKANKRNEFLTAALSGGDVLERQMEMIGLFVQRARALGVRPGVVALPMRIRWIPKIGDKQRNEFFRFYEERIGAMGVPFLALNWDDQTADPLLYPKDQHLNPAGHQAVARAVGSWIDGWQ